MPTLWHIPSPYDAGWVYELYATSADEAVKSFNAQQKLPLSNRTYLVRFVGDDDENQ